MSYGYGANSAYVLNVDKIKELNLPTWVEFLKAVEDCEDINHYIYTFNSADPAPDEEEYVNLYRLERKVQKEFNMATGLFFEVAYHDCDADGSTYDDVDGVFFTVWGVRTFTPAGQKAADSGLIKESWWVTGG